MPIHRKNKTYSKRMNGGINNLPASPPPDQIIQEVEVTPIPPTLIYEDTYIGLFGGAIIIIVIFIIIYAIMNLRY